MVFIYVIGGILALITSIAGVTAIRAAQYEGSPTATIVAVVGLIGMAILAALDQMMRRQKGG